MQLGFSFLFFVSCCRHCSLIVYFGGARQPDRLRDPEAGAQGMSTEAILLHAQSQWFGPCMQQGAIPISHIR